MALFIAVLGLALLAPAFPLLVLWLDHPAPRPVPPKRRFVRNAAAAGSLGILPAGFLFILGAYGDWVVLFLIAMLGALYGALVGAAIAWLRAFRHRDHTG